MTTETKTASLSRDGKPQRRHYIDWLRGLAVLLLFPFHTARIFDTFSPRHDKDDTLSDALTYSIAFMRPWRPSR